MNPLVSVVMAVYNNERDLPRAMDSLQRQTYDNVEFVIVNDGSTDGCAALLEEYARADARVRVITQANAGLGPSLNRACREARGKYLARHDADDASVPTRLERQVAYMEENPDVVVCGTAAHFLDEGYAPVGVWEAPGDAEVLLSVLEGGSNPLVHGSVMMRTEAYRREPEGYRFARDCDDMDLWLRLSAHGRLGCLPSVEYLYTVSSGSVSFRHAVSRPPLAALCVRLHGERLRHGRETSDWRAEVDRIVREADAQGGTGETALHYAQALALLQERRWWQALRSLLRAARGRGRYARRARLWLALFWAAPLLRWGYRRRVAGTAQTFLRAFGSPRSGDALGRAT